MSFKGFNQQLQQDLQMCVKNQLFNSPFLPPTPVSPCQGDGVHQLAGAHPLQRWLLAAVLSDHRHPAGGPGPGAELRAQPRGLGAGPEPARHPASVHPGAAAGGRQGGPRRGPEERQPDERDQRRQGRVHAVDAGRQVGHEALRLQQRLTVITSTLHISTIKGIIDFQL